MDEAGNTKDDLTLPKGTDDSEKLASQIQADFDAGKELVVTVLKVAASSLCFCWNLRGLQARPTLVLHLRPCGHVTNELLGALMLWHASGTQPVFKQHWLGACKVVMCILPVRIV